MCLVTAAPFHARTHAQTLPLTHCTKHVSLCQLELIPHFHNAEGMGTEENKKDVKTWKLGKR